MDDKTDTEVPKQVVLVIEKSKYKVLPATFDQCLVATTIAVFVVNITNRNYDYTEDRYRCKLWDSLMAVS